MSRCLVVTPSSRFTMPLSVDWMSIVRETFRRTLGAKPGDWVGGDQAHAWLRRHVRFYRYAPSPLKAKLRVALSRPDVVVEELDNLDVARAEAV